MTAGVCGPELCGRWQGEDGSGLGEAGQWQAKKLRAHQLHPTSAASC